ncbi:serine/threonine protein kinase [Chthonomonas calidirosea]|uniref:non-specific serine/threonine protein kinase n=1 Tax=Chthonomonas calidirosea (strain DSM 23976 / ICMP 18418 / T49) TaxID=1303518 RepID=S0EY51_CHTCT|nr:serine/threonine-protein kinase [Chthonomonas calidirosea]CCW35244.1 Serine/threonine protein kinase [Chthonomonas calidirosea T49]CEK20739.1 serine/threonine protein kinase [Chthonomonas calidirosea]
MDTLIRGKYRLIRELARSNDIVYEARDELLDRRVAIKILNLPPTLTGAVRRERIERFNREARAAGKLSHPNIVSIYEYGEENGNYFIAMEFLEGQSLRDILAVKGALPVHEAVDIACQVLDALAYAHAHNVIHRDIKPDNIHIYNGRVKLTDFGIARLTEEPALTQNGQIFGTPSYMSPEQIEGRFIDHRSDLFSLGVVLYEMLTGRKPFTGDSVVSITYGIMNADPPPMMGVPASVEQVVRRALSKNPNLRPASAEEMRQELQRALQMTTMNPAMGAQRTGSYYPAAYPPPASAPIPPVATGPPQGSLPPSPANVSYGGGGLPWSWSKPGPGGDPSQMAAAPPVGAPSGTPLGPPAYTAAGLPAYGYPPNWPVAKRRPSFEFSLPPGLVAFLGWAFVAIALGVLLAAGVIFFLKAYSNYQQQQSRQIVLRILNEGSQAYAQKNYAAALQSFLKALRIATDASQKATAKSDIAYTYVQLARQAMEHHDLQAAEEDYQAALQFAPGYAVAHQELSELLRMEGRTQEAAQESQLAQQNPSSNTQPPTTLSTNTSPLPGTLQTSGPSATSSSTDFLAQRRREAQQDIQEAQQLLSQGDRYRAERQLEDAVGKGAGLPEGQEAQQLLDQLHGMNAGGDTNVNTLPNYGDLGGGF